MNKANTRIPATQLVNIEPGVPLLAEFSLPLIVMMDVFQ